VIEPKWTLTFICNVVKVNWMDGIKDKTPGALWRPGWV
jgi:hypothetical protein